MRNFWDKLPDKVDFVCLVLLLVLIPLTVARDLLKGDTIDWVYMVMEFVIFICVVLRLGIDVKVDFIMRHTVDKFGEKFNFMVQTVFAVAVIAQLVWLSGLRSLW